MCIDVYLYIFEYVSLLGKEVSLDSSIFKKTTQGISKLKTYKWNKFRSQLCLSL